MRWRMLTAGFWESGSGTRTALGLWSVVLVVLTVMVASRPESRTVTTAYRDAAIKWVQSDRTVYENPISGFLYLPQGAMVFLPFTWVPRPVGEVLWRYAAVGLLLTGLWRVAELGREQGWPRLWGLMAVLVIPASLASARNGQTNLHLAGLFLHVGVDLARGRNGWAVVGLLVALALKPIAVVPLLLVGALVRAARWKLVWGLVVFMALPFLRWDPGYAWEMWGACVEKMRTASRPDYHDFCDLEGMFRTWGIEGRHGWWTGVRVVAALGTLGAAWRSATRLGALGWPSVLVWGVWYLMLFNPRTEANSYAMLGPCVAWATAWAWSQGRGRWEIGLLVGLALALGCDSYGNPIHPWTNLWFKAVVALVFGVWMGWAWVLGRGRVR
ncbi:MAG: glycosyltransferase family 87 protein [Verrucomicrobiia bacterium]